MSYDAAEDDDEGKYREFIKWLISQAAEKIRADGIELGVAWYLETAYTASLSGGEVVDFFCISSDSVCEHLGFGPDLDKQVIDCFDRLNPAAFGRRWDPSGR